MNALKYKSTTGDRLNLTDAVFTIPDEFEYSIYIVRKEEIARPDLVAIKLYNNPEWGILLCKLNGISNPFELNEGDRLICPTVSYLYNFMSKDTDITDTETAEKIAKFIKEKNEKRKPSEVTTGDSRYVVDKNRRIVIY